MPKLTVQNPDGEAASYEFDDAEVKVGRADDNDIVIAHDSLSGHHAMLFRTEDGSYAISDSNSTNGTFVNGQPIESVMLPVGEPTEVIFGQVMATFFPDEAVAESPAPEVSAAAGGPAMAPAASGPVHIEAIEPMGRPANFKSVSPYPKGRKKKDPLGAAAMGLGFLALLVAVSLAGVVFVFLQA